MNVMEGTCGTSYLLAEHEFQRMVHTVKQWPNDLSNGKSLNLLGGYRVLDGMH